MSTTLRGVDLYVATRSLTTFEVRAVDGYALASTVEPVTLRRVNGYALVDMVRRPNLNVFGKDGLLAAINKEKGVNFISSQLTFAAPQPNTDTQTSNNTTIVVTARKSSGYSGSYTFQYARFPISEAFDGQTLDLPATVGTTIWGTLAAINTKFAVKLDQTDVADGPIAPGATSFSLTALSSSIYFTPGSTVRIGDADHDVAFATVAPVTDLNSFDPELADLGVVINGSTISWD